MRAVLDDVFQGLCVLAYECTGMAMAIAAVLEGTVKGARGSVLRQTARGASQRAIASSNKLRCYEEGPVRFSHCSTRWRLDDCRVILKATV